MDEFLLAIKFFAFFALIFSTCYLIHTSIKYHKYQRLHDIASWSISGDRCPALGRYSHVQDQIDFLLYSQVDLSIPEKHRLSTDDYQTIASILADFQLYLARGIALSKIETSSKAFWKMSKKDFFMAQLYDFLLYSQSWWIRKDCDYEDLIKDRRSKTITDFGICVFKIHYITHLYCKGSPIFNPSPSKHWNDSDENRILSVLEDGVYLKLLPPSF